MPAAIKHTKTTSSRSALLILIVANFSSRSSRYKHYHSTMNARVDALKIVPGGVDMVKAHIAAKRSIWA